MFAIVNSLGARLSDFAYASLVVLGVVLCSVAPASAVTYIVDGIPLDKYDSAVDIDMKVTVTFVKIDDPKDSFLWYKKTIDIDITKIEPRILYGDTRDVISSTAFPAAATGYRMRTTPDPFVAWTTAAPTPLPAALPLFATGLGALGLFGWRSKRKSAAAIPAT
jgi:hypothetical protein